MKKQKEFQQKDRALLSFDEVMDLFKQAIANQSLRYSVWRNKGYDRSNRITVHYFLWKNEAAYQISEYKHNAVFHTNCRPEQLHEHMLKFRSEGFHPVMARKFDEEITFNPQQKGFLLSARSCVYNKDSFSHDRKKNYLMPEGVPSPSLIALGIMNEEGRVLASSRDKFVQVNRFLEMISDLLSSTPNSPMEIVDFGCGKAYLSFALYEWLAIHQDRQVSIKGVDIQQELMRKNQELADSLGFKGISFHVGDIQSFPCSPVDMVICLHACDTATDDAILQGVKMNAQWILAAPCCQHDLYDQCKTPGLKFIWKHGILKERLSSLLTDAFRTLYLEAMGYAVQVVEFVDSRHSPKNILLRATKSKAGFQEKKWKELLDQAHQMELKPYILEKALQEYG